jgi:hypothetical protein
MGGLCPPVVSGGLRWSPPVVLVSSAGRRKAATVEAESNIPLKEGYFELQLPNVLFEGNPKSITINWIDFYR